MTTPNDRPQLPLSLDRTALERVLARAAELQAGAAEPGDSMTETELVALGQEVGIAPEQLRQALAEERTRVALPPSTTQIGGFFGPNIATASRVVLGTPADLLAQIDQWMANEECLQVRRRFAERVTWEPRRDLIGSARRMFNVGGRGYALTRAAEVGATAVAVDAERSIVRLDADLTGARQRSVSWGAVTAGTGAVAGAGVLGVAASFAGSSMVVAAVVAGAWALAGAGGLTLIARGHRHSVLRVQTALEQVLDRLEHGEIRRPPSIIDVLAAATRKR